MISINYEAFDLSGSLKEQVIGRRLQFCKNKTVKYKLFALPQDQKFMNGNMF